MLTRPQIIDRDAEPFVAIRMLTTMDGIPSAAPGHVETLFRRLGEAGIEGHGPLFFKYNVIDMAGELEIDIGVSLHAPAEVSPGLITGLIPAGRYAQLRYFGDYDNLYDVNAVMIGWIKERALRLDAVTTARGDQFAARLEIYHTDTAVEPDPGKWETELVIRLADDM